MRGGPHIRLQLTACMIELDAPKMYLPLIIKGVFPILSIFQETQLPELLMGCCVGEHYPADVICNCMYQLVHILRSGSDIGLVGMYLAARLIALKPVSQRPQSGIALATLPWSNGGHDERGPAGKAKHVLNTLINGSTYRKVWVTRRMS